MKSPTNWFEQKAALGLIALLFVPSIQAQQTATPTTTTQTPSKPSNQAPSQTPAPSKPQNVVPAPDPTTLTKDPLPQTVAPVTAPGGDAQTPGSPAPQAPAAPAPAPIGTAAAPSTTAEGTPASRPAGAAIAPGKQRRIRTFAISLAILAAAGIAIGVVVAASAGSPARPN